MAAGADSEDVLLLMSTIDLQSWFRMLAVTDMERFKAVVYASARYRADVRIEIGNAACAHHGKRTTSLFAATIDEKARRGS